MEVKERTDRITQEEFFDGIFALLTLDDFEAILYNEAFEKDLDKIFQEFRKYAEQNEIEMVFRIQLHPIRGDSLKLHEGIASAMQRGIITLDSPGNEKIRIKLTKDWANAILDDITGGKLFRNFAIRIIEIFSANQ